MLGRETFVTWRAADGEGKNNVRNRTIGRSPGGGIQYRCGAKCVTENVDTRGNRLYGSELEKIFVKEGDDESTPRMREVLANERGEGRASCSGETGNSREQKRRGNL